LSDHHNATADTITASLRTITNDPVFNPFAPGRWAIAVEDGPEFAITLSDDGGLLTLICPIAEITPQTRPDAFQLALQINFHDGLIGGAAVAMDEVNRLFVLKRTLDESYFGPKMLTAALEDFAAATSFAILALNDAQTV
jgi:hypothetical protein